jgi:hypothetical protein
MEDDKEGEEGRRMDRKLYRGFQEFVEGLLGDELETMEPVELIRDFIVALESGMRSQSRLGAVNLDF